MCVCMSVSGQEAAGESKDSGATTGRVRIVHMYFYICALLTDFNPDLLEKGAG